MIRVLALVLALGIVAVVSATSLAQDGQEEFTSTDGQSAIVDPEQTAVGATPTPSSTATPVPFESHSSPEQTPTPVPTPTERTYTSPGYGNAAFQKRAFKRHEIARACASSSVPPTSRMLGTRGVVGADPARPWVPIVIAVAAGAAIVAVVAFRRRKRAASAEPPGTLEGVATLVAICGGLAGLAAQFVPGAAIKEPPPKRAEMVVRDVKPRITRKEFARAMRLRVRGLKPEDLAEVGNVVWLQIGLAGFKHEPLRLIYGLYDPDAREALLPRTDKAVPLPEPEHDAQTLFQPIWVGYPRSRRFIAEFRLVDRDGVQQIAATGRMPASEFRYVCNRR